MYADNPSGVPDPVPYCVEPLNASEPPPSILLNVGDPVKVTLAVAVGLKSVTVVPEPE